MRIAKVIYNPVAGSGRGQHIASLAETKLAGTGWTVDSEATEAQSGAAAIARTLAEDVELLVVAGGDGSIREALSGLGARRKSVTLAVLPMGNANVVARELGIPLDPVLATDLLAGGAVKEIDLGVLHRSGVEEPELFLAMVGIGWDAIVVHYIDRIRRSRLGRLMYRFWSDGVYILCGLLATLHIRPARFQVHLDDVLHPGSFCAAHFCNFHCYGKGMSMAPDAHCTSGRIHHQLRRVSHLPALLWHLIAAQMRRKPAKFISTFGESHTASIHSQRPLPVQVDGDFMGWTQGLRIEVLPRAARLLVREKSP